MRSLIVLVSLLFVPLAVADAPEDIVARFSFVEGQDNVQPGCTTFGIDWNPCHQIATSMNGLDSPKIDVLILVPASPTAERDMRIMRQSVEMWADGIEWMANDMGLEWLGEGVEFHIFAEMINTGESEFTTYPVVDPEIVVIATNPVGGLGIGIDPSDFIFGNFAGDEDIAGPCHGVANPFDMDAWSALPGYDSHHNGRGGTYVEDCDGAGGNVCFAVNGAIDPMGDGSAVPGAGIEFGLYDLVSHEVGHCLTIGHVGDGAEGSWSAVPTNDIMAYHSDPPGKVKCVSSLDVEAFAVMMSEYLDANGDGVVNADDKYWANDAIGDGDGTGRPFQVQHRDNHYYASPTGKAIDCPQPDFSPVPLSEVVNFTPELRAPTFVAIDSLGQEQMVAQGLVNVAGRVNGTILPDDILLTIDLPLSENITEPLNVTVPVRADGTYSANIDLSNVPDGEARVIGVHWFFGEDLVDAHRVQVWVNQTTPVDEAALAMADVGPRPAVNSEEAPGLTPVLFLVALVFLVARRRS